jgi:hypothetical protein
LFFIEQIVNFLSLFLLFFCCPDDSKSETLSSSSLQQRTSSTTNSSALLQQQQQQQQVAVNEFLSQLPITILLGPDGRISAEALEELMLMEAIRRSLVDVSRTFLFYFSLLLLLFLLFLYL